MVNASLVVLERLSHKPSMVVALFDGKVGFWPNLNRSEVFSLGSVSVSDGRWHDVIVNVTSARTLITVDGFAYDSPTDLSSLGFNSLRVLIGQGVNTTQDRFYKGCLDDVRINQFMLPFGEHLTNATSDSRFLINTVSNIQLGCHSDDVCGQSLCVNNGTCEDEWNSFKCRCTNGFDGHLCDVNVDDCATGQECHNGGVCIDGIAMYSCQCTPGFAGSQ